MRPEGPPTDGLGACGGERFGKRKAKQKKQTKQNFQQSFLILIFYFFSYFPFFLFTFTSFLCSPVMGECAGYESEGLVPQLLYFLLAAGELQA